MVWIGDSDHDAIVVRKILRTAQHNTMCIKKRLYKAFIPDAFNLELSINDVNSLVLAEKTLLGADTVLHRELKYVADKHAPVKTVQLRKG